LVIFLVWQFLKNIFFTITSFQSRQKEDRQIKKILKSLKLLMNDFLHHHLFLNLRLIPHNEKDLRLKSFTRKRKGTILFNKYFIIIIIKGLFNCHIEL